MWSSLAAVLGVLGVVVAAAEARTIGDGGVNYLQSLVDTLGDEGTKRFNTFTNHLETLETFLRSRKHLAPKS